jgi:lipoyl(octanoyl) transferase
LAAQLVWFQSKPKNVNQFINKKVNFLDLGLKDYKETWDFQEELFAGTVALKIANRKADPAIQEETSNYLLFVEHPHVYTLGKSGELSHLLLDQKGLEEKGATFYKINRGGDITYHGPGQLVGYPILDLDNFFTDIHKYLRLLEEAIILTLAEYDITAGRIEGLTGVWLDHEEQVNPRKICALGVKSSRWVTMHGFAFNVNAALDYFHNIVPCGISDKAVTSLDRELGRTMDMEEVKEKVKKHIIALFDMELVVSGKD